MITSLQNSDSNYMFTAEDMLIMTLWKVNRLPGLELINEVLNKLNKLAGYNSLEDSLGDLRDYLKIALKCKGIKIARASTYLRFRNPKIYQIIDQRVWRQLKKFESQLENDWNNVNPTDYRSVKKIEDQIELYINYLIDLRTMCDYENISFEIADQYYYDIDKKQGNSVENY